MLEATCLLTLVVVLSLGAAGLFFLIRSHDRTTSVIPVEPSMPAQSPSNKRGHPPPMVLLGGAMITVASCLLLLSFTQDIDGIPIYYFCGTMALLLLVTGAILIYGFR